MSIHFNRLSILTGIFLSLATYLCFSSLPVRAQTLKIVSWNLENMMSKAVFDSWKYFCSANDWVEKDYKNKNPKLTFCDAHSGKKFGTNKKTFLALHDWNAFEKKISALNNTAKAINADIYALQEISDIEALKLIFPSQDYDFYATNYELPQNLGFAISKKLKLQTKVTTISSLAIKGVRHYKTRPGLELVLENSNIYFKMLNLHLKSGCKNFLLDSPRSHSRNDRRSVTALKEECDVLREQVPYLKDWVKQQNLQNVPFILLGDFNRLFAWELNEYFTQNRPQRLLGSDSFAVASNITSKTKLAYLFPELDYSRENSDRLNIAFAKQASKKYFGKNRCSYGDDYFIWNSRFTKLTDLQGKTANSYSINYKDSYYSEDSAQPSDHCPIAVELPFKDKSLK